MTLEPVTLQAGPFTLRPFDERDIPAIFEASQDPYIPLMTTVPNPCDKAAARAFIHRQHERLSTGAGWSLAIAEGEAAALGEIGLWPQKQGRASVGYWVLSSARGKGVAFQALRAISQFGLMQFARLELYVEPWNEASWRTAEKAGFRREGLLRQYQEVGGERRDMFMYSLLNTDLPERHQANSTVTR
ncbi:GNAT family N-acetyltransferase [Deinococcus antarcticus]|uniref:GNAT family N-acetyltransferase n=1 Tax=Deinococcus antarcticus TaxID=1298767 RepID=A0ABV8A713_9DEIO